MKKIILSFVLLTFAFPALAGDGKESAFDRVVKTQTLRCGYGTWSPGVYKDLKTGEMKGLFVEMLNEAAKMAKIKVEWVAEVNWGQISESLRTRKIDAFCSGMANNAARAKQLAYTIPISYWSFDVAVRADDTRFSSNLPLTPADLNKPEYSTAFSMGDKLETIKETELSQTKGVSLPPLGTPADNIMHVLTKKTDFVIAPRVMIQEYEKQNGKGKLRLLEMKVPLRVYGNVIAVDIHEQELVSFLNASIGELINSSSYDRIMKPYNKTYPDAFLKPKLNYDMAK